MDVSQLPPFSNVSCPTCAGHMRVNLDFGPYTLVRRHAIGGMSMVFIALDHTLDREVALKILSETYSADERRITAFEEEARITASFSHPHVVRVLRTGKAFGRFYIAMELVPGGHFEHQIRERGTIPEAEMLPFAIEVAQGLKAAHAAGLIHRDVKPGNILLDADGHAKLVDFGLALVTHGGQVQATELWATPYYVPPETIEGLPEDFRSDIYAFGATIYHALAGKPSCGEETMATDPLREAKRNVIPLGDIAPHLSAETCAIIDKAMAYDPADRFSSYDELLVRFAAAIQRLKNGAPSVAVVAEMSTRQRLHQERKKRQLLSVGGVAGLGLIAAGLGWASMRQLKDGVVQAPAIPAPTAPEATAAAALPESLPEVDVSKNLGVASEWLLAKNYEKAIAEFTKLSENRRVQEPTRSWAGIQAVIAAYLDGKSADARRLAAGSAAHAASSPQNLAILGPELIQVLGQLAQLAAIPAKSLKPAGSDASMVMARLLAGLKNWEQGLQPEALVFFTAVSAAELSADEQWLKPYQKIAGEYLADAEWLSSPVFREAPVGKAAILAAIAELETIQLKLKTRGRARYNVRAWQFDLQRQLRLLGGVKP
jgi:eukaryotic-like serine/threonine-protein kinase